MHCKWLSTGQAYAHSQKLLMTGVHYFLHAIEARGFYEVHGSRPAGLARDRDPQGGLLPAWLLPAAAMTMRCTHLSQTLKADRSCP